MFNPATNKIINGVCEFCGVLADTCVHYSKGGARPVEELDKMAASPNPLPPPKVAALPVEPLREEEKAASLEEAQAKKAEVEAEDAKKERKAKKAEDKA